MSGKADRTTISLHCVYAVNFPQTCGSHLGTIGNFIVLDNFFPALQSY